MTDDFSNIIQGIFEGRVIFANLKKFISYVLASNVPELNLFFIYLIFLYLNIIFIKP